ncbi:hypothetical protein [Actinoplanes sp. NPDC048796]|uniref:hypothetical protein n=1 Tax=Actinoplanes sp. NPDC048796 TaxID=3155640 RepID=UPI0033EC0270
MVKVLGGTAVALSLGIVVLSGCSKDSTPPVSAAPPAAPLTTTATATSSAPATVTMAPTTSAPAPVPSLATTVAVQPTAAATKAPTRTAAPSRPAGVHVPNVGGFQPGWVNGTVTAASGSCVTVKDDAGTTWSLYTVSAVPVTKGSPIRARVNPGPTKVNCGKGQPGTLVRAMVATG